MAVNISATQGVSQFGASYPAAHSSGSLYVGDLAHDVTEANLFDLFSRAGAVSSIRVCRDSTTRRSLGYAYVNYHSIKDAETALNTLNFAPIKERPCRVMWSHRDPSIRRNTQSNVFVKNLGPEVDSHMLYDTFSHYGNILSCKVATDSAGQSKGFGYIHFESVESAEKAIAEKNDNNLNSKKIYVGKFEKRQDRSPVGSQYTNIYVKNLPAEWDESKLRENFSKFGNITSLALRSGDVRHKGLSFGFVNFETHEQAAKAVEEAHTIPVTGEKIQANRFQKKAERLAHLRRLFDDRKREHMEKTKNRNLYVKNLEEDVDDAKLKELFAPFGETKSVVVMKDERGVSRGFGFVCFAQEEDAAKALHTMNGRVIGTKQLYVNKAQRREERNSQLETFLHSSHPRMPPMMFFPGMQPMMFPAQSFPPPHRSRVMVPNTNPFPPPARQQQQYHHQQQPSYYNTAPQNPRGPRPQAMSSPRGGGYMGRPNSGGGQRYRGGASAGPMRHFPREHQQQPLAQQQQQHHSHHSHQQHSHQQQSMMAPQQQELSASMLASVPPEMQKQILGERLYPMVYKEQPENAAKITGMFLEMETSEILTLLDSPVELSAKIQEALAVLQSSSS